MAEPRLAGLGSMEHSFISVGPTSYSVSSPWVRRSSLDGWYGARCEAAGDTVDLKACVRRSPARRSRHREGLELRGLAGRCRIIPSHKSPAHYPSQEGGISMAKNVKPVPDGYHTVTPYLVLKDAKRALEFYKKAFGAETTVNMPSPDGRVMHAEVKIGDSVVFVSDEL